MFKKSESAMSSQPTKDALKSFFTPQLTVMLLFYMGSMVMLGSGLYIENKLKHIEESFDRNKDGITKIKRDLKQTDAQINILQQDAIKLDSAVNIKHHPGPR